MSEIKLVLTDLDGTLVVQATHNASSDVEASVRETESQGVAFAAVTGRRYWMAEDLLRNIGFRDPCVFENGGLIMNPATEEILWSRTVPVDTTRSAVEILMKKAAVVNYGTADYEPREIKIDQIVEPTYSVWASVPAGLAEDVLVDLSRLPGIAAHGNPGPGGDFSHTGIHVTHVEADKEHAVRALLSILGIDKAHTLAIGDGENDLPLFRVAAIKVAMGNASDRVKALADYVVPDVHHDGFAVAMRKYVLTSIS